MYHGFGTDLSTLYLRSTAKTRSISPENPTGGKGLGGACPLEKGIAKKAAKDLGTGWKVNPYIIAESHQTVTLGRIDGPGCIQHIWLTPACEEGLRNLILRIYWDNSPQPSVECPLGDFFACGWGEYAPVSSLAVCVNPGIAFNCYWQMPFRKNCVIELENRTGKPAVIYYQIDYSLADVPEDACYFHAQFRRVNPLPYQQVYSILDQVNGWGQYVGTYMCWGSNNAGWWGEGEIKFYLDGDGEYPTICGTGTEDYFCGSYNFENQSTHQYQEFSSPYSGMPQVIRPDGVYRSQTRFGLYRWHIVDPIRFEENLRVTIQALGWRKDGRYLPLQDDLSSVAFWYQDTPSQSFPALPGPDDLEII